MFLNMFNIVKAGFDLKAVSTSLNMAFEPIFRASFKQRQIPLFRANVLRFCVKFWVILGMLGKRSFFLKDRLN